MALHETKSERLIADYLRELRVAAWNLRLPRPQAEVLESEARASIAAAVDAAGRRDEATVHRVLDRLGPPSDIVARATNVPRSGAWRAIDLAVMPVKRVQGVFDEHGWGLSEIGALLLLIVGPFFVWWIGPIAGILLVRAAADRWSDQAMHRATVLVASLLGLQALVSVALFAQAMAGGGSVADELQRLLSLFAPGGASGPGLTPPSGAPGGLGSLSPLQILIASPAYVAGVVGGVYLALSPRHRR